MTFKGSMVALVTPMHADGSIDESALQNLIEWHISAGTEAIIVAGTTGESATLSPDEHMALVTSVVKQVNGRIPVIAGSGTNATRTSVALTQRAAAAGADACLIVTPYYNKPTQAGLIQHYQTIADQSAVPIILYNVPGRTACDLLPETVAVLSQHKKIVGIKEATGKLERLRQLQQGCAPGFAIYSGDDATALDYMLAGAHGVISVTANIVPAKMRAMCAAAIAQDQATARDIDADLQLLHQRLFVESNPIPAKWALEIMGKIKSGIRLPLLPLDKRYHQEVKEAMQNAGVS